MVYDLIIIGAGPAGISASIYAVSRGVKTLILEKRQVGGVIRQVSNVTHYSGIIENETGKTFATKIYNQALDAGVVIKFEEVTAVNLEAEIKEVETKKSTYQTKTVIIANGTTPRHLGIPGEQELIGKGVDYYLSDDLSKYKGKEIFVVGGSDGALKEALFLSKLAKQVTVIHFEEKLGAVVEFTSKAEKTSNLKIRLHTRLTNIKGSTGIETLEITDVNTNETEVMEAPNSFVFIYAGSTPNSAMYSSLENENGYIIANEKMQTKIPGVYAVGDICKKEVRQIATAVSDGAIAGIQAAAYLRGR
ncbi:thioredoxin reductase [Desulfosporosinus acidiphilus SJ4]|uniref:Thioredoxin reductase n=1 Tax=Desulfosporosinus acidiphilus (strain DSM 22704 / JCM 16185 / SJ4) TaxID=646529 RepID=I4D4V7_DESAJ|nr:NAD(P)/FAD-dependent oxidoreductase [Desulfosporosinus acidiphilus]AFM40831.1 thioredoxin reductase [Desulfosporosinus acidiphilus SJ4]